MTNIVYYQNNYNDGKGAAFAAWLKLDYDNTIYKPIGYYDDFPEIEEFKGKNVFVFDFSFRDRDIETLIENAKSVVFIANYRSLKNNLENVDREKCKLILDTEKSGCVLVWEYFFGVEKELPKILQYIQDYDLWRHKFEESKYAIQSMYNERFTMERWDELKNNQQELDKFVEKGKILYEHELNMSKGFLKKSWKIQVIDGKPEHNLTVVNAPLRLASKIGEMHKNNGELYPVLIYQEFQFKCSISMRNGREKFDLGKIATTLAEFNECRGGGHAGAAGISPRSHFNKLIWRK